MDSKRTLEKKTESKEKEFQPTQEEQAMIVRAREAKERQENVEKELLEVLTKYNAKLSINPHSPFGNPMIMVELL